MLCSSSSSSNVVVILLLVVVVVPQWPVYADKPETPVDIVYSESHLSIDS